MKFLRKQLKRAIIVILAASLTAGMYVPTYAYMLPRDDNVIKLRPNFKNSTLT